MFVCARIIGVLEWESNNGALAYSLGDPRKVAERRLLLFVACDEYEPTELYSLWGRLIEIIPRI